MDVHISRIRRSLQIRPERGYRIKTVYQHGYRLEPIEPARSSGVVMINISLIPASMSTERG